MNFLPSILALGSAAIAALLLVISCRTPPEKVAERLDASRALAIGVGIQSVHFAEEAATGFHERLGALFDLPAMLFAGFVVFNLIWIGIWVA